MQCPCRFLKQPSPKPVVAIKMAIIGPPKSGKTGCEYQRQVDFFSVLVKKFNFSLIRGQNRLKRE